MCGICGIYAKPGSKPVDARLLERMNNVLHHRGPDDGGTYIAPGPGGGPGAAGLAMRRLSIIDLRTGHQPIGNEDGTVWIVFNGEIYNHQEVRSRLEAAGHRFTTRTDTEAILHAYEEYGVDCVRHLRGMFGFAIWDERAERLFLARDPVGIKPLYWAEAGDQVLFGSEIKALLQDDRVPRRVNQEGLHHFLTYLYVPPPQTLFADIHQLPPGHRMVWERGRATVEEYWTGPDAMLNEPAGEPVPMSRLWDVLRDSVEAHMLADVPLGAFLSGGLDSTLIVALMAELSSQPVSTFSIGFSAAGLYNELPHARQVAQHFKTEHHEFDVKPDTVELLPQILRHLDEPLADASVIPNYLVAELARKHVKVALTGIGGDELFGGYRRYFGDAMARKWARIPGSIRRGVLLPALRMMPSSGDTRLGDANRLVQKFLEPLDLSPERRYLAWNAFFSEETKKRLYAEGAPRFPSSDEVMLPHFRRVSHREFADQAMYVDTKSYLAGDPLFLSDRMTMAHSLEARVPFVDVEVMEFAARIPLSQKVQGRKTKVILRDALAGKVPEEIIHRPKQGFGTPIDLWLRNELAGLTDRILSPENLRERGYFRPEYVSWLREQHATGKRDFSQHIWALLVFELWHRMYIDQNLSDRPGLTFDDLGLGQASGGRRKDEVPAAASFTRQSGMENSSSPSRSASREEGNPTPQRLNTPAPQSPLRILMVADVDPVHVIGGAERMLNEHCTRLAARGHRVTVLTRRDNPDFPAEEEHRGVRVVRHPVGKGGGVAYLHSVLREGGAAFARLLDQESYDLINVHQPLAGAAALDRAESRGLPVLYTYLSPWSDEYRIRFARRAGNRTGVPGAAIKAWVHVNSAARERIERRVLLRSERMLVLSEFSTSQLTDIHHIPTSRVQVIPGGVDTERFRPRADRPALRRELGLPEGFLLFTVRNLVPRMGLDSLIAAMRLVVDARPDTHLRIGGSGPLKEPLLAQVRELGLERNVEFTGFIPEERLPDYYGAADAFVLPTRCLEGFGLVTVEAMACGTPVLGTPIGGTCEILRGFDSSFLFAGVEKEDIAARLLERIPEIEGNAGLRERCRQHVLDTFSWDVLIPQVEALMTQVAASHSAPAAPLAMQAAS